MTAELDLVVPADVPTIQTVRQATGSLAAATTTAVTVAFPEAFADLNFTVSVALVSAEGTDASALRIRRVKSVSVSQAVVLIDNAEALTARAGVLHVTAIHD